MNVTPLSKFITEHRTSKGYSIRKLAELANISHAEVFRIEKGERQKPSPPILKALAIPLGVTYDEIMQAAGYMDSTSPTPVIATRHNEIDDLTDEEYDQVRSYIEFLRSKRV